MGGGTILFPHFADQVAEAWGSSGLAPPHTFCCSSQRRGQGHQVIRTRTQGPGKAEGRCLEERGMTPRSEILVMQAEWGVPKIWNSDSNTNDSKEDENEEKHQESL